MTYYDILKIFSKADQEEIEKRIEEFESEDENKKKWGFPLRKMIFCILGNPEIKEIYDKFIGNKEEYIFTTYISPQFYLFAENLEKEKE